MCNFFHSILEPIQTVVQRSWHALMITLMLILSLGGLATPVGAYNDHAASKAQIQDSTPSLIYNRSASGIVKATHQLATETALLVKDIYPGPSGSFAFTDSLTNFNGTLYFAAGDNSGRIGLWMSDGTTEGTTFVKNIPGARKLTVSNGELFFTANDAKLWKSDGTSDGTIVVKDLGSTASLNKFTDVNGVLFFYCL